jgi:hypothetical protein
MRHDERLHPDDSSRDEEGRHMPEQTGRRSARERGMTVDDYAAKRPPAIASIIQELRRIARAAAPEATETIKWGQPVYEQDGPFAFIKAASHHVSFGFWRGAALDDPDAILEGSGEVMRHTKIREDSGIPSGALTPMIRQAVRLNEELGDPTKRRGSAS